MKAKNKIVLVILFSGLVSTNWITKKDDLVEPAPNVIGNREFPTNREERFQVKATKETEAEVVKRNLTSVLRERHEKATLGNSHDHTECLKRIEESVDEYLEGGNQIDDLTYEDQVKLEQLNKGLREELEKFVVNEDGQLVDKEFYEKQIAQAADAIGTYAEDEVHAKSLDDIK